MVNYAALTDAAHPDDVRGFAQWASAPGREWETMPEARPGVGDALGIIIPFIIGPIAMVAPFVFLARSAGLPLPLVLVLLLFVGFGFLALFHKFRSTFAGLDWEAMYRVNEFAEDNGLRYLPALGRAADQDEERYPGQLFAPGARVYQRLRSASGRFFEIGSVRRSNGGDGDGTWHLHRGYLAVQLDRRLPQIVLDAVANSGAHSAHYVGGTGVTLRLEGDFNDHFTLRVPPGYERDALYVLTPDLMALLIDETSAFDVELIDDWMFVYSPEPFVAADAALYERLFRILSTVGVKAISRSTRYRDERRPWAGAPGARFSRGTPTWVAVVGWGSIAAFVLAFVLSVIGAASIPVAF